MRVPAADFHDLQRPTLITPDSRDQPVNLLDQDIRLRPIAKLVDISHAATSLLMAEPRSSASSV